MGRGGRDDDEIERGGRDAGGGERPPAGCKGEMNTAKTTSIGGIKIEEIRLKRNV